MWLRVYLFIKIVILGLLKIIRKESSRTQIRMCDYNDGSLSCFPKTVDEGAV